MIDDLLDLQVIQGYGVIAGTSSLQQTGGGSRLTSAILTSLPQIRAGEYPT